MQQGRIADARRVLDGCRQSVERVTAAAAHDTGPGMQNMGTMMSSVNMSVRSYAEMRANFIIDAQLWNDDVVRSTLPAGDYPFAQFTFDYTNALAAIRRGDLLLHELLSQVPRTIASAFSLERRNKSATILKVPNVFLFSQSNCKRCFVLPMEKVRKRSLS